MTVNFTLTKLIALQVEQVGEKSAQTQAISSTSKGKTTLSLNGCMEFLIPEVRP